MITLPFVYFPVSMRHTLGLLKQVYDQDDNRDMSFKTEGNERTDSLNISGLGDTSSMMLGN